MSFNKPAFLQVTLHLVRPPKSLLPRNNFSSITWFTAGNPFLMSNSQLLVQICIQTDTVQFKSNACTLALSALHPAFFCHHNRWGQLPKRQSNKTSTGSCSENLYRPNVIPYAQLSQSTEGKFVTRIHKSLRTSSNEKRLHDPTEPR